jgi:predicted Zn-dependent protease
LLQQYAAVGNDFPLVIVTDVEKADSTILTPNQNDRAWTGITLHLQKKKAMCIS